MNDFSKGLNMERDKMQAVNVSVLIDGTRGEVTGGWVKDTQSKRN